MKDVAFCYSEFWAGKFGAMPMKAGSQQRRTCSCGICISLVLGKYSDQCWYFPALHDSSNRFSEHFFINCWSFTHYQTFYSAIARLAIKHIVLQGNKSNTAPFLYNFHQWKLRYISQSNQFLHLTQLVPREIAHNAERLVFISSCVWYTTDNWNTFFWTLNMSTKMSVHRNTVSADLLFKQLRNWRALVCIHWRVVKAAFLIGW